MIIGRQKNQTNLSTLMDKKYRLSHTTNPENPDDPDGIHQYYLNILSTMPNNVYWVDKNCIMQGCNDNVLKMLGLEKLENFIGITYDEVSKLAGWTEGQAESFERDDIDVITVGKPKINVEEPPIYDDKGNPLYYISTRVPLFDQNKSIMGVAGISIDISERKKMEEDLRLAMKKTEAANHGLTLMTSSVVHELRTPLTSANLAISSIKKYLPPLISAYNLADDNGLPIEEVSFEDFSILARCAEIIQTEIKAANTFIDMLLLNLTQPKLSAEKMQDCSINQCIEMALERYPLEKDEKNRITFEPKADFIFKGNQLLIIHIIFNLLKNALYYMKLAGKGKIDIWLECSKEVNKLHFKDTAQGVAPEVLPHIFERFYSNTQGGSGVGLAFCKMAMKLFGGEIHCESIEGDYAEFILSFPTR